jgi:hypothetical protein
MDKKPLFLAIHDWVIYGEARCGGEVARGEGAV